MLSSIKRYASLFVGLSATILAFASLSVAPAAAASSFPINLTINQVSDRSMTLSTSSVHAGIVGIRMSSASPAEFGHYIAVVHRNAGVSLDDMLQHLMVIFDPSTPGDEAATITQGWLRTHSTWYGGYHANQPGALNYQTILAPGHYDVLDLTQLSDLASAEAAARSFDVTGFASAMAMPSTSQAIVMLPGQKISLLSPDHKLHTAPVVIANTDPQFMHLAQFNKVPAGTTNDQVSAMLANDFNSFFVDFLDTGAVSYGVVTRVDISGLATGRYAVGSFMPDPHNGITFANAPDNMHLVTDLVQP